jgi:pSer/pThr/pTyr-binding forkhead associated (FHA) protein
MQSAGTTKPLLRLIHVQTTTLIEIPQHLTRIRLGKPNTNWLPDIDLSKFPNSDIVSRSHLEISREDNNYFIEDLGSANGTYLNGSLLRPFTPYQIRIGDKIDLGKNERFTLLFREARQPSVRSSNSNRTESNKQPSSSRIPNNSVSEPTNRTTSTGNRTPNQRRSNQEETSLLDALVSLLNNLISIVGSIASFLGNLINRWISRLTRSLLKLITFLIILFLMSLLITLLAKNYPALSKSAANLECVPVWLSNFNKTSAEPCRIRVPYTNENRPPSQPSCDCPYDRARNYSICGARSAYVRPGGREPACYIGETTARERWYRDDNPDTHFVDRERKGR